MTVAQGMGGAKDGAGVEQGMELGHAFGPDHFVADAEVGEQRRQAVIGVKLLLVGRQAQAASGVKADRLAGFLFRLLVDPDRIGVEPGDTRVVTEIGHIAGGVPGRPGGQVEAFEQGDVGPARPGQAVEHTAADNAAADDDGLGVIGHDLFSCVSAAMRSRSRRMGNCSRMRWSAWGEICFG